MNFKTACASTGSNRSRFTSGVGYRWKRMVGSAAAVGSAATATSSLADVVQITQVDNSITATTGTLNADLTGDGVDDVNGLVSSQFAGTTKRYSSSIASTIVNRVSAKFSSRSSSVYLGAASFRLVFGAGFVGRPQYYVSVLGDSSKGGRSGTVLLSKTKLIPIVFTDSRINGGLPSNALIDVRAASLAPDDNSLTILRLVFDDASILSPTKVLAGGTNTEWISPEQAAAEQAAAEQAAAEQAAAEQAALLLAAEKSQLTRKIKNFKSRAKSARRKDKLRAARNLLKKYRLLKQQLKHL